ncbi:MAG: hypothetical protein DRP09_20270 [Candidatus Thorarchaeota archaeon]|nr:MAG: hypothetical protein DRP09_20270 [Candidatus Thorarchaeota archaeon]
MFMETKLKKVVKKRGLTLTQLAREFCITRVHLTNIANGEPAGKKLAKKIEEWSQGEITHTELLYPKKN